ncbi:hypothetical protein AAMO2058_000775500 [Amorphochlora amoebiformis]
MTGIPGKILTRATYRENGSGTVRRMSKKLCPFCQTRVSKEFQCASCVTKNVNKFRAQIYELQNEQKDLKGELSRLIDGQRCRKGYSQAALNYRLRSTLDYSISQEMQQVENRKIDLHNRKLRIQKASRLLEVRKKTKVEFQILKQKYEKVQAQLKERLRQKIESFLRLYPIRRRDSRSCSVVGIVLPDSTQRLDIKSSNISIISTALSYILLITKMISRYIFVPLPHKMVFRGSHSYVIDCARPSERMQFSSKADTLKALSILDQNITDLCSQAAVPDNQIIKYHLLPNLLNLVCLITTTGHAFTPGFTNKSSAQKLRPMMRVSAKKEEDSDIGPRMSERKRSTSGNSRIREAGSPEVRDADELGWSIVQ